MQKSEGVLSHWAVGAVLAAIAASSHAVTTVGSLSNFDAVNDTGGETYGFEIELEGLSPSDVLYEFGGSYSRYGSPTKVNTSTGVIVRWSADWDPVGLKFTTATPVAPVGVNPGGHDCYNGGPIGNYLSSGCEHFGVSLGKAQGNTTYRWLVADTSTPGTLVGGNNVRIPAPIFSVAPAADPVLPPVVQAVIPAPIPEVEAEPGKFSDAMWMKRIKTQIETDDDIQLEQLLLGNNGQLFNPETETEYEWFLIQSRDGVDNSGEHVMDMNAAAGKKGLAIRYEFYEFAGTYDPESHEAWCFSEADCENLGPNGGNTDDVTVQPYLGKYVGSQMAGVNFAQAPVPEPGTYALFGAGALFVAAQLRSRRRTRRSIDTVICRPVPSLGSAGSFPRG